MVEFLFQEPCTGFSNVSTTCDFKVHAKAKRIYLVGRNKTKKMKVDTVYWTGHKRINYNFMEERKKVFDISGTFERPAR